MKNVLADIKSKNFKQAYLFFGDEIYLKLQYKRRLLKALNPEDDTMNFAMFEGKSIDVRDIISMADTMPFFADYRVILIQDSGLFKSANDEIIEYFKNGPTDTTIFVFVEENVDKRSRFYKTISGYGRTVEFTSQDENTLKNWIARVLAENGHKITVSNANYFLAKTGNDMSNISTELEKLISYVADREEIRREDIDSVVTTLASDHVFDMIDAIALKQQNKALDLYYELVSIKKESLGILALLARHFNKLLQAKDLKKRGYNNNDIAKKISINSYYIGKYIDQATRFKSSMLIDALEDCADMEDKVKKGLLQDKLAVEMLICKYSV